jgi:hypothetical protein
MKMVVDQGGGSRLPFLNSEIGRIRKGVPNLKILYHNVRIF